ncbi:hypothetical protein STIAU_5686 [Stigmatella aurantiaca DW4/3-1]|uniref:Uncharacterized protein n=1 Tax=Stigmatella aurantiaca (strain DW4/3-1) TaxID=378806 RepID=Q08ZF6_STIAD|nr:hypothetical protein STIAU_5686 [Stigmatella aurantiaca DW4/3-1]
MEGLPVERVHAQRLLIGLERLVQLALGRERQPRGEVERGAPLGNAVPGQEPGPALLQGREGEPLGEAAQQPLQVAQAGIVLRPPFQVTQGVEGLAHAGQRLLHARAQGRGQGLFAQRLEHRAGLARPAADAFPGRVLGHPQHRVVVRAPLEAPEHRLRPRLLRGPWRRRGRARPGFARQQPFEALEQAGRGIAQLDAEARCHAPRLGLLGGHVPHHLARAGQLAPGQFEPQRDVLPQRRQVPFRVEKKAQAAHAFPAQLPGSGRPLHQNLYGQGGRGGRGAHGGLKGLAQRRGRGEAIFRALGHGALQHAREGHGHRGAGLVRQGRWLHEVRQQHLGRVVAGEGELAGDELVAQHPGRVQVCPPIHGLTAALLGRHELRRAQQRAALGGHPLFRRGRQELGDAEVEQLHPVPALRRGDQEDVGGLDVAVDDAVGVRGPQRVTHLRQKFHGQRGRQGPLRERGEALPLQVLHDQIGAPLAQVHVEERDDVRVLDPRERARLGEEALHQPRITNQVGVEHLHRHALLDEPMLGQPHRAHAPAAQLAHDAKAAEGLARQRLRVRAGRRRGPGLPIRVHALPWLTNERGTLGPVRVRCLAGAMKRRDLHKAARRTRGIAPRLSPSPPRSSSPMRQSCLAPARPGAPRPRPPPGGPPGKNLQPRVGRFYTSCALPRARLSSAETAAVSSPEATGLHRCIWKPSSKMRRCASMRVSPHSARAGMRPRTSWLRISAKPSSPGSRMSLTSTSGRCCASAVSASAREATTRTSAPALRRKPSTDSRASTGLPRKSTFTPLSGGASPACSPVSEASRPARSGRRTVKVAPVPGPSLCTSTVPPCSSTMVRTMASPSPSPPCPRPVLPCRKRSKTCGKKPASMPLPVSLTVSATNASSRRASSRTHPPRSVNFRALVSRFHSTC